MSDCAAAVRDPEKIAALLQQTLLQLGTATHPKLRELLLTQAAVLTAMAQPIADPKKVLQIVYENGAFRSKVRAVRPIPEDESFFETMWRGYRENQNIY